MKMPTALGPAGQKLWTWAAAEFETDGCQPLLAELCVTADRLEEVRNKLHRKFDVRLINAEVRLAGQYTKIWRLLGLADSSNKARGKVGYPAGMPRGKRVA
jgi:hypothetical protein